MGRVRKQSAREILSPQPDWKAPVEGGERTMGRDDRRRGKHPQAVCGGIMNLVAQIRAWWYAITDRTRVHQQVETELQFHVDAYTEDLIRSGATREDAQRRARLELGKIETQNERYR